MQRVWSICIALGSGWSLSDTFVDGAGCIELLGEFAFCLKPNRISQSLSDGECAG